MRLAAFCAGRLHGNTEVFMKEALMAAEAKGIEVKFYRLRDFELEACTNCYNSCPREPSNCPHKDDAMFLINEFLDCDGYLIGAPVFSLTPNSLLFTFRDRIFGPKQDVAGVLGLGMPEDSFVKGRFKARPGAMISVGGAGTEHWTAFGLPSLYTTTFSAQTEIVDHMNVYGVADHDAAVLADDWISRAHKLGENLADAMLTGDHRWRGEAEGTCPGCHLNLVQMNPGTNEVVCPVCGIRGTVKFTDGLVGFEWPDDEEHRMDDRLQIRGKITHLKEVIAIRRATAPRLAEAKEKMGKYIEYKACEVPSPLREAAKAALREQYAKKIDCAGSAAEK